MDGFEGVSMGRGRPRERRQPAEADSALVTSAKAPVAFPSPPTFCPKAIQVSVSFKGTPKREVVLKSAGGASVGATVNGRSSLDSEPRRELSSGASKGNFRISHFPPTAISKAGAISNNRDIRRREGEEIPMNESRRNESRPDCSPQKQRQDSSQKEISRERTNLAGPLGERGATLECFNVPSSNHVPVRICHFVTVREFYLVTTNAEVQLEAMRKDFDPTFARAPLSVRPGMKLFAVDEKRSLPERIAVVSTSKGEAEVCFLDSGKRGSIRLGPDSSVFLFQMPRRWLELPPLAVRARLAGLAEEALPADADAVFRALCRDKQLKARSCSTLGQAATPVIEVQLLDGANDLFPVLLKSLGSKDKVPICAKELSKNTADETLRHCEEKNVEESKAFDTRTGLDSVDLIFPSNAFVEVKILSVWSPSSFELSLCSDPTARVLKCALHGISPASSDSDAWDSGVVEDLRVLLEADQEEKSFRLFAKSVGRRRYTGIYDVVLKDEEDRDVAETLFELGPDQVTMTKALHSPSHFSPDIEAPLEGAASTVASRNILVARKIVKSTDLDQPQHQVDGNAVLVFSSLTADHMDLVWFRRKRQEEDLEELEKILNSGDLIPEVELTSGMIVLARLRNRVCRAEILNSPVEDELALIRFIDYGDERRVRHEEIFQLNTSSILAFAPPFAFCLRLDSMRRGPFQSEQEMEAAKKLFAESQFFKATLVRRDPDVALLRTKEHRYFVSLYKSKLGLLKSDKAVRMREDHPPSVALHPANVGCQDKELVGYVTHITNIECGRFFMLTETDSNIVAEISEHCERIFNGRLSKYEAELGELVVVLEYEIYKRARVVNIALADDPGEESDPHNEYKCLLLDHGSSTVVRQGDVFPLPDSCEDYPCFARECHLFDSPPSPVVVDILNSVLNSAEIIKLNVVQQFDDRYSVTIVL